MKKGMLAVLLACVLVCSFALVGCSSVSYATINGNGYSLEFDKTWSGETLTTGLYTYRPTTQTEGNPSITIIELQTSYGSTLNYDDQLRFMRMDFEDFTAAESGNEHRYLNVKEGSFGSNALITADYEFYMDGKLAVCAKKVEFYTSSGLFVSIEYNVLAEGYDGYRADMEHVIGSVKPL